MKYGSTGGISARPGWVKVWVAAMQSYDRSFIKKGRNLVGKRF